MCMGPNKYTVSLKSFVVKNNGKAILKKQPWIIQILITYELVAFLYFVTVNTYITTYHRHKLQKSRTCKK